MRDLGQSITKIFYAKIETLNFVIRIPSTLSYLFLAKLFLYSCIYQ